MVSYGDSMGRDQGETLCGDRSARRAGTGTFGLFCGTIRQIDRSYCVIGLYKGSIDNLIWIPVTESQMKFFDIFDIYELQINDIKGHFFHTWIYVYW